MRKHYLTAVLGIFVIAFFVLMHTDASSSANTGIGLLQKDPASVGIGDKIISNAANAVSFVVETVFNWLVK